MGSTPSPLPLPLTTEYHPDFNKDVFQVVFMVDGQKFKTDAARLAEHSEFLRTMLFDSIELGVTNEGSDNNPIVIQGVCRSTFANFLYWLNHRTWQTLEVTPLQGNLDILHMCHMWDIEDGLQYAISQLELLDVQASHKLFLARQYDIVQWFPVAIRSLLDIPFDMYTAQDCEFMGFATYAAIARGKENIQRARQQLSSSLPYPKQEGLDSGPYCASPETCRKVWFTVWIREIGRILHNAHSYTPSSQVLTTLDSMAYSGMHSYCKEHVLKWVKINCPGFGREEAIIQNVVSEIRLIN